MLITFLYRLSFGDGCGAGFIAESEWDSPPEENARRKRGQFRMQQAEKGTVQNAPAVQAEKGTVQNAIVIIGYRLSAIVYYYRLSVKKRISYR